MKNCKIDLTKRKELKFSEIINLKILCSGVRNKDIPVCILNELLDYFEADYACYYISNIFKNKYESFTVVDKYGNTEKKGVISKKELSKMDICHKSLIKKNIIKEITFNDNNFYWNNDCISLDDFKIKLNALDIENKKSLLESFDISLKRINEAKNIQFEMINNVKLMKIYNTNYNKETNEIVISLRSKNKIKGRLLKYNPAIIILKNAKNIDEVYIEQLNDICDHLSVYFKFIKRIYDEKKWIATLKKLILLQSENFNDVFKNILSALVYLKPTIYASYWSYLESFTSQPGVFETVLAKNLSMKYENRVCVQNLSDYELILVCDGEKSIIKDYANNMNNKILNEPNKEFVYDTYFLGFKDPKQGEMKAILRNHKLWTDINADKIYIIPIFKKNRNNGDVVKNSDVKLRGLLSVFPHKHFDNLLFYNKEVFDTLSDTICEVVENSLRITKDKITEMMKIESKNYLDNFQLFLEKVINITKKHVEIDGCSIFFFNKLYDKLELYATTGIRNKKESEASIYYSTNDDKYATWNTFNKGRLFNTYISDTTNKRKTYCEKYEENIDVSKEQFSYLILPIKSVLKPNNTLGIVRFVNLKRSFELQKDKKEIIIPFSDDYIEIFEHIAALLGNYFLTYMEQQKLLSLFELMPHVLDKHISAVKFRFNDLKKEIEERNSIFVINNIIDEIQSEIEILDYFADANPIILAADEIKISKCSGYIQKEIIFKLRNILQQKAAIANLYIEYNHTKENIIPKIFLDFKRIEHVIFNLLDNAIKYAHPLTKIIIYTEYNKKSKIVTIRITNIGISLPTEHNMQNNMFELGFRDPKLKGSDRSGLGIGLFVAGRLLKAHGGRICSESIKLTNSNIFYLHVIKKIGEPLLTNSYKKDLDCLQTLAKDGYLYTGNSGKIDKIVNDYKAQLYSIEDIVTFLDEHGTYKTTFIVTIPAEEIF